MEKARKYEDSYISCAPSWKVQPENNEMERDYPYEGFNIHVQVQAYVCATLRTMRMPDVEYAAIVTITRPGVRKPVLPPMHLSDRDGKCFPSAAETLLAAGTAGQRAIDDLLRA